MRVENFGSLEGAADLRADLVVIGAGAAGLTIAKELAKSSMQVVVLESGDVDEDLLWDRLNEVETVSPTREHARLKRATFHRDNATLFDPVLQAYGVRCRGLGGSTLAWAGKSAALNAIDYRRRDWVPNSGWPIDHETLSPFIDRAAEILNLGPNVYDERLWDLIGMPPPGPALDDGLLRSFFWQFARSRLNPLDILRFGREFQAIEADNVRVLVNATVTRIVVDPADGAFRGVEFRSIEGRRGSVLATAGVLAAGGIENPRMLLASNDVQPAGLGNAHDLVGRFLMDHPGGRLGRFDARASAAISRRFGFFGVRRNGRSHMYMHGLTMSESLQEREQLGNCAIYMMEERAPDDPWDALKRILRRSSDSYVSDVAAVAGSPGLLAKGLAMRALQSDRFPSWARDAVVDGVIRMFPNMAVREFRSRGLPHKLTGLAIDGIAEQPPDPHSRITLSERTDRLGMRLARVDWRVSPLAARSLLRLAQVFSEELERLQLPAPKLEDWVVQEKPEDAVLIDMGHTAGTTRMGSNESTGVVDESCQVFGVPRLYVAGSSVFPTAGHANPTLMLTALAVRLADRLKMELQS